MNLKAHHCSHATPRSQALNPQFSEIQLAKPKHPLACLLFSLEHLDVWVSKHLCLQVFEGAGAKSPVPSELRPGRHVGSATPSGGLVHQPSAAQGLHRGRRSRCVLASLAGGLLYLMRNKQDISFGKFKVSVLISSMAREFNKEAWWMGHSLLTKGGWPLY